MNEELKKISNILEKIEQKMRDRSPITNGLFDVEKTMELERGEREERRGEEILKLQKTQIESSKRQEKFNSMIAFTGAVIALISIYSFIVQSLQLKNYPQTYILITIVFLILVILCLLPLIAFVIDEYIAFILNKK